MRQMQRRSSKPKAHVITEADIVAAMLAHGAAFRFTAGGSLPVSGLANVPAEIRQMFFDCDGQALIAHIRAMPKPGKMAVAA